MLFIIFYQLYQKMIKRSSSYNATVKLILLIHIVLGPKFYGIYFLKFQDESL